MRWPGQETEATRIVVGSLYGMLNPDYSSQAVLPRGDKDKKRPKFPSCPDPDQLSLKLDSK